MEDQTTWKGHSFTLLVFVGIVVVCSIFFILGMLVGRQQGQKFATIAAAEAASRQDVLAVPEEEKPDLTFFESVERETEAVALEPPPSTEPLIARDVPKTLESAAPSSVVNYQIAALRRSADADKLLGEVKKKGFRAFILAPASGEKNPLYRIQVGPFANLSEAEDSRKKLEAAGYEPILKK
jgi:cell division septation protein DedD